MVIYETLLFIVKPFRLDQFRLITFGVETQAVEASPSCWESYWITLLPEYNTHTQVFAITLLLLV